MTIVDALVEDYLARLDRAAAHLPPDRRSDLLEGIGEHIESARAAGAAADEAAVRTLLDRLGEPEEIVAAAQEELGPGSPAAPLTAVRRGTGHELAAVLLLTAGSFVPVIGWLVGVVLLWMSSLWQVREKLLGTLVLPFGPGAALFVVPVLAMALPSDGWLPLALTVLYLLAPVLVAVYLMRLARRRAAAAPPVLVAPQQGVEPASPWGPLELAAVLLLALGGLLVPILGALVGLALACWSPRWTMRDKLVAAGLVLLPALVSLYGLVGGRWPVPFPEGILLVVVGAAAAAVYLAVVLQRRAPVVGTATARLP